ncbi:MAG: methyltransferase domain-containing protein [bacterium]
MADGNLIFELLPNATRILDVGSPGAHWWSAVLPTTQVLALDLYRGLLQMPGPNFTFRRFDVHWLQRAARPNAFPAFKWYLGQSLHGQFDLIVMDHLLEHVARPEEVIAGAFLASKPGGKVHIGVPDATHFTDRFYHLALTDGGGHVYRFTKESLITMMEAAGWKLLVVEPWADDWIWFDNGFNPKLYGNKMLRKEDIAAMAAIFRKELTAEKGYLYGWEYVFEKP